MDFFHIKQGHLFAEQMKVSDLAQQFGTPLYIYSQATLVRHVQQYQEAFAGHPGLVAFAVKANSNLGVLSVLARAQAGFDIVSGGELERVLVAGGDPAQVVFSGVGKQDWEIERALAVGIKCFNVESEAELLRIRTLAEKAKKIAPLSLRVNPDVDAKTHPYIATGLKDNKFGIPMAMAEQLYGRYLSDSVVRWHGVGCHIGSQITEQQPFLDAFERLLALVDRLKVQGIALHHLDIGGGLGVCYQEEQPPLPKEYIAPILPALRARQLALIVEPGRSIAAHAGIFVTRVLLLKQGDTKHFAVVDGAMNDLLRPSLYGAWQEIVNVAPSRGALNRWDIVGPICESSDFLGRERLLCIAQDDLLAVRGAGAYGFVMASNYNTRPRAAEILVAGDQVHLVRRRETVAELLQHEMPVL